MAERDFFTLERVVSGIPCTLSAVKKSRYSPSLHIPDRTLAKHGYHLPPQAVPVRLNSPFTTLVT